jgi:cytosine deaminase
MDLIIRKALVVEKKERMDIGIVGEKIVRISPMIGESGRKEIDAEGCLAFPGFVDPHVHMDKCLVLNRLRTQQDFWTLEKRIAAMRELKKSFTEEDVRDRIVRAAQMAARNGTLTTRTHVETDPIVQFKCVRGALAAKSICSSILDIQTIAFPQEGWIQNKDGSELESRTFVGQAMGMGIDVVGGTVNRSVWETEPEHQVDELFDIARKKNADIDIHLDNSDNPVAFTLPYVARKTIAHGYQGRVTVAHIPALAAVPDKVARRTIDLVREAEVNVCVLPNRIRLTRVKELVDAGVNVTCGTDNMQDAFVGVGHADLLYSMILLAEVTRMGFDGDLEKIFRMGTVNAAKALRIEADYGIDEGKKADVVLLQAPSVPEAIRSQARRRAVIKRGRIITEQDRFVIDLKQ